MSQGVEWDRGLASRVIEEYSALEGPLLPILHALQDTFGCIPEPATALIAETLNLSRAEVHGVISFYHDFRRTQPGKLVVKLCRAEACQAMGGPAAAEALLRRFQLDWGGTAADGSLTIDPVYCLGLCAVAPAALVGEAPVGHLNPSHLIERVESAL